MSPTGASCRGAGLESPRCPGLPGWGQAAEEACGSPVRCMKAGGFPWGIQSPGAGRMRGSMTWSAPWALIDREEEMAWRGKQRQHGFPVDMVPGARPARCLQKRNKNESPM